ncbi:hypothetical protein JXL19_02885 [bacterium]|nr:hypothetical protein [bacterium]
MKTEHRLKTISIFMVLLISMVLLAMPIVAQAQRTCRIAINYDDPILGELNPFADFDPVVQDELKCSYWGSGNEGHYIFVIEHEAGLFINHYDIVVTAFPDGSWTNWGNVTPDIIKRTGTETYFRIGQEHVNGIADTFSFAETYIRVQLYVNNVLQNIDPTDSSKTERVFRLNNKAVDPFDSTLLPASNTTIYNFFNAYIDAGGLNDPANGGDGLYCFMDDITDPANEVLDVLETGAFADLSVMTINVPGTLAEGTYDLRFRAATTGARHEGFMPRYNITLQQYLDPITNRNATTDYGVSAGCPDKSFDIRLPIDLNDTNKSHYTVWYGNQALVIDTVYANSGADDIIELDRAWILSNTDINDNTWNDLDTPLVVVYDNGVRFYAGVDDGVGPRLMRVQIFGNDTADPSDDETHFVFSSDLAGTPDANDFKVWNGAGSVSTLDFTTFEISGNEVIAHAALVDGDRVNMDPANGITDLNGNQALVLCANQYETAHTVRMIERVAATDYMSSWGGDWEIMVEFNDEMLAAIPPDFTAEDPNLYEVSFPEPLDPTNAEVVVPYAAFFIEGTIDDPYGITYQTWQQKTVVLYVNHPTKDTSPANMPTVTIKPVQNAAGAFQPLGLTGGDFTGDVSWLAEDKVGPYIVQSWYMIDGECGKTSSALLSEGKHFMMIEWSEPLSQTLTINKLRHDWFVFDPIDPAWQNIDVPFGLDWSKQKGLAAHLIPGITDANRVLTINLGTSANGASPILYNAHSADPEISIVNVKLDNFRDVLGNTASTYSNDPVSILNKTVPWIEEASTRDNDSDGFIDEVVLTWNRGVWQIPFDPANDPLNHPLLYNSSLIPDKDINSIDTDPHPVHNVTHIALNQGVFPYDLYDTNYTGTLDLFVDANNYFVDAYGNRRDFKHQNCPVLDKAPAAIVKVCFWNGAVPGTYAVEVNFSEAVEIPDTSLSPSAYFVINPAPTYKNWLDVDGSDGVISFLIQSSSPPAGISIGTELIKDLAGNQTTVNPTNVQGPADKPDYFAYPDVAPFDVSGPKVGDASMEIEGFIFDQNGSPLSLCLTEDCDPGCGAIVMAFRHADLFDQDPCSPTYCQLVIDPARCSGATQLRRGDGYYALHVSGGCCGTPSDGEAIILVVIPNPDPACGGKALPYNAFDPNFQDDFYIMTGLVPADAGFYIEWHQGSYPDLFNMFLDMQEKIYVSPNWNFISTTIDKSYGDEHADTLKTGADFYGPPLLNWNGVETRDKVPVDDIDKVWFTISPPCGMGWQKACTFDSNYYGSGGFVQDYPATHVPPIAGGSKIAFFGAGNGYMIKMAKAGVLVVLGDSVIGKPNQPYYKQLTVGWNMAGYWSDWLRMVATGPSITNFAVGDFSSAMSFPLVDGVNVDNTFFTPDEIFLGANATYLRTYVNIDHSPGFKDIGVRVWDDAFQTFDLRYIGPGMAEWINASSTMLYFD